MYDEELVKLVKRAKRQQADAIEELYTYSYPIVANMVMKNLGSCRDCDDIIQETLVSVYLHIVQLKEDDKYIGWLKRITWSKCYSYIKKEHRMPLSSMNLREEVEENNIEHLPSKQFEKQLLQENLCEILHGLKKKDCEVLALRYFNEMSEKEIARYCHIPEGTVKSRLYSARLRLKEKRGSVGMWM